MCKAGQLHEWAEQIVQRRVGILAVVRACYRYGVAHDRACHLAEEAAQEAMRRACNQAKVALHRALTRARDLAGECCRQALATTCPLDPEAAGQRLDNAVREGVRCACELTPAVVKRVLLRASELAPEDLRGALALVVEDLDKSVMFLNDYRYCCNWLRRVAINYALSVLRREGRNHQLDEGDCFEAPLVAAPVQFLRELLLHLPEESRELLRLRYEDGHTLDELAALLLPPDDRSANARRLTMWRRLQTLLSQLRE